MRFPNTSQEAIGLRGTTEGLALIRIAGKVANLNRAWRPGSLLSLATVESEHSFPCYVASVDVISQLIDWLVDNEKVGLPLGAVLLILAAVAVWYGRRLFAKPTTHVESWGKLQETSVHNVVSKGDVNVNPRQE